MANPNYELEERAIYRALSRVSDDFSFVKSGFQHWHSEFSHQELDLNAFVDSLRAHLGLSNDQKRVLVVSLHSSLSGIAEDLEHVPGGISAQGEAAAPSSNAAQAKGAGGKQGGTFEPATSAHHVITHKFLQTLAKTIAKSSSEAAGELSEIIEETISSLEADSLHKPLLTWAGDGFEKLSLPKTIGEQECINLAHFIYLASCDAIGPVKSDALIDKIISALADTPEAERFDPSQLL